MQIWLNQQAVTVHMASLAVLVAAPMYFLNWMYCSHYWEKSTDKLIWNNDQSLNVILLKISAVADCSEAVVCK